jgi:hypothetical protein
MRRSGSGGTVCLQIDCAVGAWSGWSECDAATGRRERTRPIVTRPSSDGRACPTLGDAADCAVACVLGAWAPWGECSASCGGGRRTRRRAVDITAKNGGTTCGSSDEADACNTAACIVPTLAIDGFWDVWNWVGVGLVGLLGSALITEIRHGIWLRIRKVATWASTALSLLGLQVREIRGNLAEYCLLTDVRCTPRMPRCPGSPSRLDARASCGPGTGSSWLWCSPNHHLRSALADAGSRGYWVIGAAQGTRSGRG